MADESQSKGPNASKHSAVADFIGTVWGKVLTVLAAITMLLGIAAEGVSLYRNWWEARIARSQAAKTQLEYDAASVPITARNLMLGTPAPTEPSPDDVRKFLGLPPSPKPKSEQ
jgi:hypothetical protein